VHWSEAEIGDESGEKYDAAKEIIFNNFSRTQNFGIEFQFKPNEEIECISLHIHVFSYVQNGPKFSIGLGIQSGDFYSDHGGAIYNTLAPFIIDLFRELYVEYGYSETEYSEFEECPSIDLLQEGKVDLLTSINFYKERHRMNLPPHKGKEILLDEGLGLFCFICHGQRSPARSL